MDKKYIDRLSSDSITEALDTSKQMLDRMAEDILATVEGMTDEEWSTALLYHKIGNIVSSHLLDTPEREITEFEFLLIHIAFKTPGLLSKIAMKNMIKGMLKSLKPGCDGDCDNCEDPSDNNECKD